MRLVLPFLSLYQMVVRLCKCGKYTGNYKIIPYPDGTYVIIHRISRLTYGRHSSLENAEYQIEILQHIDDMAKGLVEQIKARNAQNKNEAGP
jgi:hypothetical protein